MSQLTDSSMNAESLIPDTPPPLPKETPPPLPSSAPTVNNMNPLAHPPPSMYQGYYQQYMQWYIQYTQSYAANGVVPPMYAAQSRQQPSAPSAPAPSYLGSAIPNNKQAPTINYHNSNKTDTPPANPSAKSAIKFNLKFNNSKKTSPKPLMEAIDETVAAVETASPILPARKSRFDTLSNITAEQDEFNKNTKKAEIKHEVTSGEKEKESEEKKAFDAKAAADIVFDIHKWPNSLKNYCTKVYTHYQKLHMISEDQVTKYLQQRITETFKQKPDLNIAWDTESIPDLEAIRKVAPLSQQQIMQQKKQEAAVAAAKAAFANKIQMKQKMQQQQSLGSLKRSDSKTPKKRKLSRSRSASSSSSSESSSSSNTSLSSSKKHDSKDRKNDDYISLVNSDNKKKNLQKGKKKTLKNIQVNSMNGKKSYSFVQINGKNSKLDKKLKKNLVLSNESEHSDSEDESKSIRRKQQSEKLAGRQQRFQRSLSDRQCFMENQSTRKNLKNIFNIDKDMDYTESIDECCIGQCQDLEKEYFRLTGPPEPCMVRPQNVLEKSLKFVLKRYEEKKNYRYICEQLKSIRQDLSVQWIQNEFTIEVYETHARIAIRNKDRDEFNQCQSKLKYLYGLVLSQSNEDNKEVNRKIFENSAEFIGYRLLYNMLTKSHNDLNQVIKEIKLKYSGHVYLEHLLSLRNALHLNNYVKFFRLYAKSNELSKCLIDLFIERVRKLALKIIIKSYRPSIKVERVTEMLAYESIEKCKEDLLKYKLIIQSVPIVSTSNSDSTGGSNFSLNSSPSIKKLDKTETPIPNSTNNTSQTFEEVLDCKSCTLQGF